MSLPSRTSSRAQSFTTSDPKSSAVDSWRNVHASLVNVPAQAFQSPICGGFLEPLSPSWKLD
jgi:hypothetical protein